jgi:hypothetical protein
MPTTVVKCNQLGLPDDGRLRDFDGNGKSDILYQPSLIQWDYAGGLPTDERIGSFFRMDGCRLRDFDGNGKETYCLPTQLKMMGYYADGPPPDGKTWALMLPGGQ